jgi:hypothetical protein
VTGRCGRRIIAVKERLMPEATQPTPPRQPRHCRHCLGDCPGCLLDDGQCIHGWNGKRPREFTWRVVLTRRWWDRVLWGTGGTRG